MRIFFGTLFLLMVLLFSCNNHRSLSSKDKVVFTLHPQPGTKYYYTITNETNTTLEVNDQKIKTAKTAEIGLIYETQQDSAGNSVLKITYDKFHIELKDKDGKKETWDAANAATSEELMDKLLSNIKGSILQVTLSPKGDIINIAGTQVINDKIMAGLSTFSFEEKKQVQTQLSQLTGEEFVKNNLQQGFKLFPDSGVNVGSSWSRKSRQSGDLAFEADSKYTLDEVEDNIASVTAEGNIKKADSASTGMFGAGAQVNITGKQTGNFKTDIKTGMLLQGKTGTTIEGTVTVMGHEVPITVKMNKTISSKKIE